MGVIEASGFARKGVPMTGKQSTAEWLRGIVDGAYRNETYPTCAGIVRTFFGLECPDVRSCGSCILAMLTAIADRIDAERALLPQLQVGGHGLLRRDTGALSRWC